MGHFLKILKAQKEDPVNGDWTELVKEDLKLIGESFDENKIKNMNKGLFKYRAIIFRALPDPLPPPDDHLRSFG